MLDRSAPPWVVVVETRRQRAIRQLTIAVLSLVTLTVVLLMVVGTG